MTDVLEQNSTLAKGVDDVKIDEKKVSDEIASESGTIIYNLSFSERRLIKAYLGYIKTEEIKDDRGLRDKNQAPTLVRNVLWPSSTTDEETSIPSAEKEDKNFHLDELLAETNSVWEVPTIFNHTPKSLEEMFLSGRNRTPNEQISLVKTFQVSKRE